MIHEMHKTGVTGQTGIYYMRDQHRISPAFDALGLFEPCERDIERRFRSDKVC